MGVRFKIISLLTASVFFTALFIAIIAGREINSFGKKEIQEIKTEMMKSKRAELKNYLDMAFTSIKKIYDQSENKDDKDLIIKAQNIIRELRYGKSGYVFFHHYDGTIGALGPKPELEGKNIWEMKDAKGLKLMQAMTAEAKKGEGYVHLWWPKPGQDAPAPKLNFVMGLQKWQMFLGTGFYLDDIDAAVAAKQKEINARIRNTLIFITIASAVLIVLFLLIGSFMANIFSKGIIKASNMLKEISEGEGDLTSHLEVVSKDEIGVMSSHFNNFIDKLKEIIQITKINAESVAAASTQLASATEELSVTINDQASQVTGVASATEEMSVSSNEILNSLDEGLKTASGAVDFTNNGMDKLKYAVNEVLSIKNKVETLSETISGLTDSSNQIGDILNVISDIADQTNLLALNAAIEAARAGDQGRGFAVVADEVRKLAERTQNATSEIDGIITNLQSESKKASKDMQEARVTVDDGVAAIHETETVFESIVSSVNQINELNSIIGGAIQEQVAAIQNINDNAQTISSGIEESSASLSEVTNTVSDLSMQAEELNSVVSRFKTN